MTFPGDQPVASGQGYTVTEVDGHRPTDLSEFIGTTAITLLRDGHSRRLVGDGAATSGTIRFHQKARVRTTGTSGSGPSPTTAAARSSPSPPHPSNKTDRTV